MRAVTPRPVLALSRAPRRRRVCPGSGSLECPDRGPRDCFAFVVTAEVWRVPRRLGGSLFLYTALAADVAGDTGRSAYSAARREPAWFRETRPRFEHRRPRRTFGRFQPQLLERRRSATRREASEHNPQRRRDPLLTIGRPFLDVTTAISWR